VINVNWLVAGLVAIFLLAAALLLLRGGGDSGNDNLNSLQTTPNAASTTTGGQVQAPPASDTAATVQGKAIGPIQPGKFPDFVGSDLASALAVLRDNQMNYVIIETASANVPRGIVMKQTPGSGSKSTGNAAVYLTVSTGPSA
jgi:hypothetical protein